VGTFIAVPGLNEQVAVMVAPEVRNIAKKVEVQAKRLAPPAKKWVSMADNRVRDTHIEAHSHPAIPSNLRFEVRGQPWDIEHGLSPGTDWLLRPKDTSSGLPADSVQHVHCRCHEALLPTAIAERIVTGPAEVYGTEVRVVVSCTYYQIVECEFGDSYDGAPSVPGTRFMARAASKVAGGAGVGRAPDAHGGNYTAKPGQGGDGQ
jgi:hypothetical protein